jgi:hypothetical protein
LPDDPPVGSHGYGPRKICLAVNLARAVGLRGAERVLGIVFDWLEVEETVPDWTSIRGWMQRLGVDALNRPMEKADDWIWMADHSNQIGQEKVLVVLAVRASELPPPGTALTHDCMRVLHIQPGRSWKKEDVAKVFAELAARYGPPRALLMDGAAELREGARGLETGGFRPIVLGDFKHKAANLFKAILGKDKRFDQFMTRVGNARSATQQTELAFLFPPSVRQKARFMNMQSRLRWASMVLWLLEHPEADARRWASAERLEEKFGWIRGFADELVVWHECERIIETGVTFMNEQGLSHGTADRLAALFQPFANHRISRRLADALLDFVAQSEQRLEPHERLPMSTEILESSFGLYKQLERQHSKGGFTSLLAAFASLLKPHTPETVLASLGRTSVRDMKAWTQANLGATLASKRQATYHEFQTAQRATIHTTTP